MQFFENWVFKREIIVYVYGIMGRKMSSPKNEVINEEFTVTVGGKLCIDKKVNHRFL
jgi:hypothetical protein